MADSSYMKEWTMHRMLARFGLPYLRTRSVRLFINSEYYGLYSFMEAPDQEYVFARSFPNYDPSNFGLYKVKTASRGCGGYSEETIAAAPESTADTTYSFERGTHREKMKVSEWGLNGMGECFTWFLQIITKESLDAVSAWEKYGRNCGEMLVEEGLIDRDLGASSNDVVMKEFINKYLTHEGPVPGLCKAEVDCSATGLETAVDQENWLKNMAVYAVTIMMDSPLGNGNNYFLAQTGDSNGWKIVQYDHNGGFQQDDLLCPCENDILQWAITRPSCGALESSQLVGPILTNSSLFNRYIEHVRNFTETVFTSPSLLAEMSAHATAIKSTV